jgi:two-component sensor histidine kinase
MKTKGLIICIAVVLTCIAPSLHAQSGSGNWQHEMQQFNTKQQQAEWILETYKAGKKYTNDYKAMLDAAIRLAGETGVDTLVARAHANKGSYLQNKGLFDESLVEINKAKFIYLKAKAYTKAADMLFRQSLLMILQGNADSALVFLEKNQHFVDVAGDELGRLRWKSMYPIAYQSIHKITQARVGFEELLPQVIAAGDTQLIISTYINLGRYYDDFDSCMAMYSKALALSDRFPERQAELMFKIGYAYSQRDDARKDSALYYLFEAKKNIQHLANPIYRCNIDAVIGDFFMNRIENKLALPYLRAAYFCTRDLGASHLAISAHNMAVCFIGLKQADSAAWYLEINRKAIVNLNNDYQYMLYYHAKGEFEALSGDSCSLKALENFDKSVGYAIKAEEDRVGLSTLITASTCVLKGDRNVMKPIGLSLLGYCREYIVMIKGNRTQLNQFAEFLNQYAKLEARYGDKAKAIALYEELVDNMSVIQQEEYIKGLGEAVVKYKSDLKDTEITLLNERERTATIRSILIIVGLLLVVCVAIVIYVLYRREHKTRQLLDERNHKVEQLLREVHHRVKNNLQIVSSFINIQMDKVSDKEARTALEDTSTRIMALAGLHQSLYRQGDLAKIHISEYIEELCRTLGSGINKDVRINCDLDELQLDIDQAIPIGLAVNELITNALKHAFSHKEHGQIDVTLKHKDKWQLLVKDNGNGLPQNMNPDELQSIGIRLVQDIAERQLNGTFSYYNESGAVFKIEFVPVAA